jgi:Tfp pilus assembly protein PilO
MTKLKQLWLLTAFGSVAVLALGWFALVSPKNGQAASIRAEAEAQRAANAAVQSKVALLKSQQRNLPQLQRELEEFARLIPDNPALPTLVRSLSDAADASGVELESIAPSPPAFFTGAPAVNGMSLASIAVTVKVTGGYPEVQQFFSEVEGLKRAFLVNGFKIQPSASGTDALASVRDDLDAELDGQMFMTTKSAPAPAAVTAPAADSSQETK